MSPIHPITKETLAQAARLIQDGRLVAFPTETVYGLGADATNEKAVDSIYEAKGRPAFNPLIIHVTKETDILAYVEWNDTARLLAKIFWPGPLTFVLPRAKECPIARAASGAATTIAVRAPSHPIAQDLINLSGRPIAAPSANASGKLSPTQADHVWESLGDKVDMILDGGPTEVGVESTVLDLTGAVPTILRPGSVTRESLAALVGEVREACGVLDAPDAPKSPGMLSSHYAPHLPLRLDALTAADDEAFITFGPDLFIEGGAYRINLSPRGNLTEAAANLYSMLRIVDRPPYKSIAVMPIPSEGLGIAINDRLARAAAPRG